MTDGLDPGQWWIFRGWRLPRSLDEVQFRHVAIVLIGMLAVWFYIDVGERARIWVDHPERHMTDFTVYTGAAAAFFDGRDPYEVANVRGWMYMYPPLFALMLAPLTLLETVNQALVWFVVSVALGFGCYAEGRKLWRLLAANAPPARPGDTLPAWAAVCIGLTVCLPTLECLQRGQVGIALLYALLLGSRLALTGRGNAARLAGCLVLAWAVVVKLVPALPVGVLLWQQSVLAVFPKPERSAAGRASVLVLGFTAGLLLFLLAVPTAVLGWRANLGYLHTWTSKVALNEDPGLAYKAHLDSPNNQSLTNAAHLLAAKLHPGPRNVLKAQLLEFATTAPQRRWAEDTATARARNADRSTARVAFAVKGIVVALLLGLALLCRRADLTGQAAGFGLACLSILLVSPVAWGHYFMWTVPALIAVPLRLDRLGQHRAARWLLVAMPTLVCVHYVAKRQVGPYGMLGLGTTFWFLAACALLIATRRPAPVRESVPGKSVHFSQSSKGSERLVRSDPDPFIVH